MDTPICDFVKSYAASQTLRLHMPGHKGCGPLGMETRDITEVTGVGNLYEAYGISAASEANASALFGCPTFYSTEGSSHCIRAMLYLCLLYGKQAGRRPLIAAGRNAHKVLLSAAALLDLDVAWLYPEEGCSYLSCPISPESLEQALSEMDEKPMAVYVTSPDYLGNMLDIAALAQVAHRHGCLLTVDCAHGAYLKFLPESLHPMDLGADLCCSSAHKTLPVLTGGAYLHTSPALSANAKNALALFGSTSPSYLILQSLDAANMSLGSTYPEELAKTVLRVQALKARLADYRFTGNEPMKLTIDAKKYGYTGTELFRILQNHGIECEFADPEYLVLMVSTATTVNDLQRLEDVLSAIPKGNAISTLPPVLHKPKRMLRIREAVMSPCETLPVSQCEGRILAAATVGCPPAVSVLVCGELIDRQIIRLFRYYGIETCCVVAK